MATGIGRPNFAATMRDILRKEVVEKPPQDIELKTPTYKRTDTPTQMTNFGATMRDALRGEMDKKPPSNTELRQSPTYMNSDASSLGISKKKKPRCMPLKYLSFVAIILMTIAALIAFVVLRGDSEPPENLGGKVADVVEIIENCPVVEVELGSPIKLLCHYSHRVYNKAYFTTVTYTSSSNTDKSIFDCTAFSNYTVECIGPVAQCSHEGDVELEYDTGRTSQTSIHIIGGGITSTRIEQSVTADGSTEFMLQCEASRICKRTYMTFKANSPKPLQDMYKYDVMSSFEDKSGHMITGKQKVDGDFVQRYAASNITCEVYDDDSDKTMDRELFKLPVCEKLYQKCNFCEAAIYDFSNCTNVCEFLESCENNEDVYIRSDMSRDQQCSTTCHPLWCITRSNQLVNDLHAINSTMFMMQCENIDDEES